MVTMMTSFSPATLAILQAFDDKYEANFHTIYWQASCLSAVLKALAARIKGSNDIRQDILDIAEELQAFPDPRNVKTYDTFEYGTEPLPNDKLWANHHKGI